MILEEQVLISLQKAFGKEAQIDFHDEKGDGKHFYLEITSERFKGKTRVDQSKMVYQALDKYMKTGSIHALRMKCKVSYIS